jgi:hypothetical protein
VTQLPEVDIVAPLTGRVIVQPAAGVAVGVGGRGVGVGVGVGVTVGVGIGSWMTAGSQTVKLPDAPGVGVESCGVAEPAKLVCARVTLVKTIVSMTNAKRNWRLCGMNASFAGNGGDQFQSTFIQDLRRRSVAQPA